MKNSIKQVFYGFSITLLVLLIPNVHAMNSKNAGSSSTQKSGLAGNKQIEQAEEQDSLQPTSPQDFKISPNIFYQDLPLSFQYGLSDFKTAMSALSVTVQVLEKQQVQSSVETVTDNQVTEYDDDVAQLEGMEKVFGNIENKKVEPLNVGELALVCASIINTIEKLKDLKNIAQELWSRTSPNFEKEVEDTYIANINIANRFRKPDEQIGTRDYYKYLGLNDFADLDTVRKTIDKLKSEKRDDDVELWAIRQIGYSFANRAAKMKYDCFLKGTLKQLQASNIPKLTDKILQKSITLGEWEGRLSAKLKDINNILQVIRQKSTASASSSTSGTK